MDKNYNIKSTNIKITNITNTNICNKYDTNYDNQYKSTVQNNICDNNIEHKQYLGYTIYVNGKIYNRHGNEVKSLYRGSRHICRLYNGKGIRVVHNVARLIYSLYNPEFNIKDVNKFVMIRDDKNIGEWDISDLYVVDRGFRKVS